MLMDSIYYPLINHIKHNYDDLSRSDLTAMVNRQDSLCQPMSVMMMLCRVVGTTCTITATYTYIRRSKIIEVSYKENIVILL